MILIPVPFQGDLVKRSFCEELGKHFVHFRLRSWRFLVSRGRVANSSGESSRGLTALLRLMPLVFAVLPRATKSPLNRELFRLVHLGIIAAERIIVVTAFVIHYKVEKRCESTSAELACIAVVSVPFKPSGVCAQGHWERKPFFPPPPSPPLQLFCSFLPNALARLPRLA